MADVVSRREALKVTAKVAGVTAFATPVVVGVFSSNASAVACGGPGESDAIPATVDANVKWNQNCGGNGSPLGRINGQNKNNFSFGGGDYRVVIADDGTDNTNADKTYYTVVNPAGYVCSATFIIENCGSGPWPLSTNPGTWPSAAQPVPYCPTSCASVKLVLTSVVCCPI
jgi:hypothetical protein